MNKLWTRRQWLARQAAWAGAAALTPLARAEANVPARSAPSSPVAIGRCDSYDPRPLGEALEKALDAIGGIGDLVRGKTVTVKLNLTGGPRSKLGGLPPERTYHVHPSFVAAACAAFDRAGARRIILVESSYERKSLPDVMGAAGWGIDAINRAGGGKVTWEDTRNRGSWTDYAKLSVAWGGFIYPGFLVNRWYEKTDVLVSLAKLKDHANAGITLAIKNLFGIAPTSVYGDQVDGAGEPAVKEDTVSARGATFHRGERRPPAGAPQELDPSSSRHWRHRVPRITADLYGIRPADLCLIDGIESNRGGEGPWIKGVEPIRPRVLLVGRNGVCTDAVGAAVMGYNPTAGHGQFPFMGDNHLALLAEKGVGTNRLNEIEIRGLKLEEAVHPFNPRRLKVGEPILQ
jgi:uncharacterized protein (DUF362 family)